MWEKTSSVRDCAACPGGRHDIIGSHIDNGLNKWLLEAFFLPTRDLLWLQPPLDGGSPTTIESEHT